MLNDGFSLKNIPTSYSSKKTAHELHELHEFFGAMSFSVGTSYPLIMRLSIFTLNNTVPMGLFVFITIV